jgi:RES domain
VVNGHKPRDIALLDALDKLPRLIIQQRVWRTVRDGRDPLEGSKSRGRWGHDAMETLYTSHVKEGSVAEIYSLLSAQPVFPSKPKWLTYEIKAELECVASLPTLPELAELGVDLDRYHLREYDRTQEIADAALFLGFTGMIVPSARWDCANLVIFTEKVDPDQLTLEGAPGPVDWDRWRSRIRSRVAAGPAS